MVGKRLREVGDEEWMAVGGVRGKRGLVRRGKHGNQGRILGDGEGRGSSCGELPTCVEKGTEEVVLGLFGA